MAGSASLLPRLLQYAQERVASARAEILSNLRAKTELPLVLDVALPGAAYFSVAAGGLCDVLNLLGDDVVKVDRFVGASGGACSLFLILANDKRGAREQTATPAALCPSADLLLQSYLEYAESEGSGTVQRSFNAFWQAVAGVSSFWEDKYRALLSQEPAWTAIRSRGFCAVAARPLRQQLFGAAPCDASSYRAKGDNYIFHNFAEREEAVQAFVATGEATAKGFTKGIQILSRDQKFSAGPVEKEPSASAYSLPASFCDGGRPAIFDVLHHNRSPSGYLYYNTWFENASEAAFCTAESIEHLYKRGVDRTIDCLLSESLASPVQGKAGKDSMVLALPGADPVAEMAKIGVKTPLYGGSFVNLTASEVREQKALDRKSVV